MRVFAITTRGETVSAIESWSISQAAFPKEAKDGKLIIFSKAIYAKPIKLLQELADEDYVVIVDNRKGFRITCVEVDNDFRDFLANHPEKTTVSAIDLYNRTYY